MHLVSGCPAHLVLLFMLFYFYIACYGQINDTGTVLILNRRPWWWATLFEWRTCLLAPFRTPTGTVINSGHKNEWLTVVQGAGDDSGLRAGQVVVILGDRERQWTVSSPCDEPRWTRSDQWLTPTRPCATPSQRPPAGEDTACSQHVPEIAAFLPISTPLHLSHTAYRTTLATVVPRSPVKCSYTS